MKSKKIIMLLLSLLLVAMIICIIIITQIKQKEEPPPESLIEYGQGNQAREAEEFVKIENHHDFYTIKTVINSFISYVKQVNGDEYVNLKKLNLTEAEAKSELQKEGINSIKGILDKQYIDEIEISNESLITLLSKYKQEGNCRKTVDYNLNIEDVRIKDLNVNTMLVLVKMQIVGKDFNVLIKLDRQNNTYSIFLEDYITKYNYNANMKKEDIKINDAKIDSNGYNKYRPVVATASYICMDYFMDFKNDLLDDPKGAYNALDSDYRVKKYGSYEGFQKYIENNRKRLEDIEIQQYQIVEQNGETQYVCLDQDQRYYIFVQKDIVNYKVILDTYTIDLPQFTEKYEKGTDKIKVGLNLQKIFDAIKDEDYSYVYNKLDKTFRENNFKNEKNFEDYVKQNFSGKELKYSNYEEKNSLHVAKVSIKGINNQITNKEFIMKLKEGTDFVMSFNVN